MSYIGDYVEDATVYFDITTHEGTGGSVAPSSAFEAADLKIYKNNDADQKTTVNGVTMVSPFDGVVGLHNVKIDTAIDTDDIGFWVTGSDYFVVLDPSDETVDSQTVVRVVAHFSIENRSAALASVCTEVRLAELDAANLPTDIAAIPTTAMRGTDNAATAAVCTEVRLAELDAANLPTDIAAIPTTAMRGTDSANTITPPTTAQITTAVLAGLVDGSLDVKTALKELASVLHGNVTVTGTDPVVLVFRNAADTADVLTLSIPAAAGSRTRL